MIYDIYINRLGLSKIKKVGNTFNFRCPICGDSKSKPNKRSAYILGMDSERPHFYCHKCRSIIGDSNSLVDFIKHLDHTTYQDYLNDLRKEQLTRFKVDKVRNNTIIVSQENVVKYEENSFDAYLHKMCEFEDNNLTEYLSKRKIPKNHWEFLYYFIGNPYHIFKKVFGIEKYDEKEKTCKNSYIGILVPFRNKEKEKVGFSIRILGGIGHLRFLNLYSKSREEDFLFGEDRANFNKPIFILEGLFDKLSFEDDRQVLSMLSTNNKIKYVKSLSKERIIYMYDYEFLNPAIERSINKIIDEGFDVFLWSGDVFGVKDINDLKRKYSFDDKGLMQYVEKNSFSGLKAKMELKKRIDQSISRLLYE